MQACFNPYLWRNFLGMMDMMQQLQEATEFVQKQYNNNPTIGIILGSGLGNFSSELAIDFSIPYAKIPHFPVSTVEGHSGALQFAQLGGKNLVIMAGRFHFYEGYSPAEVVFPIRVMKLLGVETILLSNAAGSVHPDYQVGDLVVIKDHISFFQTNPLLGKNLEQLGPRFPDMSEPYSKQLRSKAFAIAKELNLHLHEGVYTGVTGPTFETRAEYQLIKHIGGHVVGMSTVQETIAAVHAGMQVFGVSVVTDIGIREDENTITHEEVLQAAKEAEPKLTALFKAMIANI